MNQIWFIIELTACPYGVSAAVSWSICCLLLAIFCLECARGNSSPIICLGTLNIGCSSSKRSIGYDDVRATKPNRMIADFMLIPWVWLWNWLLCKDILVSYTDNGLCWVWENESEWRRQWVLVNVRVSVVQPCYVHRPLNVIRDNTINNMCVKDVRVFINTHINFKPLQYNTTIF